MANPGGYQQSGRGGSPASLGHLRTTDSIQLKSSTVQSTSSGLRTTCSAHAFSFASASSSPSWMIAHRHFRSGGTSLASLFSSMPSMRSSLGFLGARPPALFPYTTLFRSMANPGGYQQSGRGGSPASLGHLRTTDSIQLKSSTV